MARSKSPPSRFWTDDLELHVEHVRRKMEGAGLEEWISKRTGRQLAILCDTFGLDGASTQKMRDAVRSLDGGLEPYVLVEHFSQFKSKVAVLDFARGVLTEDAVADCLKSADDPDKTALLFAIYRHRWSDLRLVLHLDKIHKKGFARMKLRGSTRRSKQRFRDFLDEKSLKTLLAAYDKSRRDGLKSELKSVIPQGNRILLFVRRGERPDHLVRSGGGMIHGYRSEWIILDFEDDAQRVDISSVSTDIPVEVANRIASAYFKRDCEYENECVTTESEQLETFLSNLRPVTDGPLVLVELVSARSPLSGSPGVRLRQEDSRSVGDSWAHFEKAIGKLRLEDMESVKVLFRKKRVSLIFEADENDDGAFVVRYSDHRLNARERVDFEHHLRDEHGITVLSTEKRFKRPA